MTMIHLAGFFLLTSLSFRTLHAEGEILLRPEPEKLSPLKTIEKRTNFRVPVDTPFDPNFWPARGRRDGDSARRTGLCDGGFSSYGDALRCGKPDADNGIPDERDGTACKCYSSPEEDFLDGFDGKPDRRRKKQRHVGLPRLTLYGNGVYWEPDTSFAEKKKKQDVFWVARGKKNFL